ncbi:MAG: lysine exporter LysO family protein [Desulfovibrionaceae bacterium]|nr:lysine exporter LysO family protein [Desulfovibrionaceae bacterium]
MKSSLIALSVFIVGLLLGKFSLLPEFMFNPLLPLAVLFVMVLFVGIGLGFSRECWETLRRMHLRILLVPVGAIVGTYAGVLAASPFLPEYSLWQILAVGSGFGYYSLSSFIITGAGLPVLGSIALLSNIMREVSTLLLTPALVRLLGPLAPIGTAGATSMDTCLPVILKNTDEAYGLISIFSGTLLTMLVPVIVSFCLGMG